MATRKRRKEATGKASSKVSSARERGAARRASPRAVATAKQGLPRSTARDPLALAREVIRTEAAAVAALEHQLGREFVEAVELLARCRGKVIVSGIGKSGLLAQKIAATLTSTGTPAVFLHPTDALHGDAGLFSPGDAALFLSKSGGSEELLALMPYIERHGIPLVSIVSSARSALARRSQVALALGPVREACPMDLTPTTSITLAQVIGDCLAVALLDRRGFRPEDFRFLHPGGVIGRVASRRVGELMHEGDGLPRVPLGATLRQVMLEIMEKRLGISTVVNRDGTLAGVITDGDFKRILMRHPEPWGLTAEHVMGRSPSVIGRDALVAAAVRMMEEREAGPITALVVVDEDGRPIGILHLHDCLRAGV